MVFGLFITLKGVEYYKGNFINGLKDGEWKFFYNNSNLWKKGNFKDDLKDGYWITKYENGDSAMAVITLRIKKMDSGNLGMKMDN